MTKVLYLAIMGCFLYHLSAAQPGKPQPAAANPWTGKLRSFTNQLQAVINGKSPLGKLMGTQPPTAKYRRFTYPSPALAFPGAIDTGLSMSIKQEGTGYSRAWVWSARLMKYPKGTQTEKLKTTLAQLSRAISVIYPAAVKRNEMTETQAFEGFTTKDFYMHILTSYAHTYDAPAYLELTIYFNTPERQTREQLGDSLRKVLDKELVATYAAKEKVEKIINWINSIEAVGFDKTAQLAQATGLFRQVAANDINLAYAILMEWPRTDDLKTLTEALSSGQREALRQLSQQTLDNYYNSTAKQPAPAAPQPTPKPAVEQKEETDPCKREVAALTFRPGHWIYGEGRSALVFNYNCGIHLYTIAWMNSKGRLEFEKDISKEALASRYRRAEGYQANKFILCRDCAGKGYGYGYDRASSYIGSLRIEYNTGNLVRQSCAWCGGKGATKVQ
jgi:hypothetical protein